MALRIVMMGTGTFALPTFQGLIDSRHDVVGLFTQPDRTGRGHHQHVNPMKALAEEHGIAVFQPQRVNAEEPLSDLAALSADLCVVAAYGQILSAELLDTPRLGAINLHGSLLPAWRGAAPIQYAVLNGDTETGVTIFQIEPRLDAGPMLGVVRTPIGRKETSGALHDRLAELAVPLALQIVDQIEAGTTEPLLQDRSRVSKAPRIPKDMGQIDWTQSSARIECHLRAMQPWPKAWTFLHRPEHKPQRLILLDVEVRDDAAIEGRPGAVEVRDNELLIRTGSGAVSVITLQPEGKRPMPIADFLRGAAIGESAVCRPAA